LKKEKSCKKKEFAIYSKNNNRKFPKCRENCPFRYRKPPGHQTDLTKIELPHNILSLKQ
jgi:hypothetical protein